MNAIPWKRLVPVFAALALLYPVMASHRALTPAQRAQVGIGEGLVRLSVGIEEPADIIADLAQALEAD